MSGWYNRTTEWIENRSKELKAHGLEINNQKKIRIWRLSLSNQPSSSLVKLHFFLDGQLLICYFDCFIYMAIITPLLRNNTRFSSVQSLSRVQLFATPWITAHQISLSITNSWSSLKHVHQVGDAILPTHPLSSPSPLAPQSLPASGSFPMSQLFAWGGPSIGVSAF